MRGEKSYYLLVFIFLVDCTVLPVIKIAGLSFKVSYVLAFWYVVKYIINLLLTSKGFNDYYIKYLNRRIVLFLAVICFGELWSMLYSTSSNFTSLIKFSLGCILMLGSMFLGYVSNNNKWNFLFYCLIVNNIINIMLALLGRTAPSILLKIYTISVDTFTDGYYRNGGIIGNPNSTLLIMNVLLLCIVVFFRRGIIELKSWQIILTIIMPIACDIVVSSRGELLQTILIDIYFLWSLLKVNPNPKKIIHMLLASIVIVSLALMIFNTILLPRYPNIQLSLDRLSKLEDVSTTENDVLDNIYRPIYKFDVFIKRFYISPIWGTGVDAFSSIKGLVKATTGYHNDLFMIAGSGGIIGLILWIGIFRVAAKKCGVIILTPVIISGLSNTFIQSWAATMVYFFIIGYCIKQPDDGFINNLILPVQVKFKINRHSLSR